MTSTNEKGPISVAAPRALGSNPSAETSRKDVHIMAQTTHAESEKTITVPCTRKGCDQEGREHEEYESLWDELVLHTIRVGLDVDICASGEQPWSMFIEAREVMGTLEMEAIANDVRRAANMAADLNAPIIDQWQRVGNGWVRV